MWNVSETVTIQRTTAVDVMPELPVGTMANVGLR